MKLTKKGILWIIAVVSLVVIILNFCFPTIRSVHNKANLYYAFDIVESFGDKAARASRESTTEACQILWELHFPSFEWRGAGHPFKGRLDAFVEGQRKRAVAEVIRYLRTKTGEDLGPDPERWLSKYGSDSVKDDLKIMKEGSKTNAPNETNRTSTAAGSPR